MKKLATIGSIIATSTLLLTNVPYQEAHAASTVSNVTNQQNQATQKDRPYGGVIPQGMTQAQYVELEKAVPKLSASSNMQDYNMKLFDATQNIADKYNVTITTNLGAFKPHAVRDMNGHALPVTKNGNFYQTNVDANGVNHGGSEMVQNKTGHMNEQSMMNQKQMGQHQMNNHQGHMQQQVNVQSSNHQMKQNDKKVLPATGESVTTSIVTVSVAVLLLVSGLFLTFRHRSANK